MHNDAVQRHGGGIAFRTSGMLKIDPKNGLFLGNPEAAGLWSRNYRKGWEPKI